MNFPVGMSAVGGIRANRLNLKHSADGASGCFKIEPLAHANAKRQRGIGVL